MRDPRLLEALTLMRQRELVREAEGDRLLAGRHATLRARALSALGNALIALGTRLAHTERPERTTRPCGTQRAQYAGDAPIPTNTALPSPPWERHAV